MPNSDNSGQLNDLLVVRESVVRRKQLALVPVRKASSLLLAGLQSVFTGSILNRLTNLLRPMLCGLLLLLMLSQALLALQPTQPQKQSTVVRKVS